MVCLHFRVLIWVWTFLDDYFYFMILKTTTKFYFLQFLFFLKQSKKPQKTAHYIASP
jgi:hypothetical protein